MGVRVGFGRLSAWSAALFALVLWSPAARAEGATRAPTAHAIASYTLPNGLKVLLEEDHRQKLVAICVRYETGARDDPKGKRGLAHLVEHLTYRGSRHLKDGELATLFQRAGAADLGGETGFDATNFHATVSSSALPLALWLESERMAFSAEHFNAQSLSSELNIVHREEVLFSSSQRPLVLGTLTAMFGADHPYGAEGAEPADAKSLTLDDAREFFISGYRPDNATLVLVGDFETAAARSLIAQYFGPVRAPDWPKVNTPRPPVPLGERTGSVGTVTPFREVVLGFHVATTNLRERARLDLLLAIVNADWTRHIATGETRVSAFGPSLQMLELGSVCLFDARLLPGADFDQGESVIEAQLGRLDARLIAYELAAVRHGLAIRALQDSENLANRALLHAQSLAFFGHAVMADDYLRELDAVTVDELVALAGTFDPQRGTRINAKLAIGPVYVGAKAEQR